MKCIACGKENVQDARFCAYCGAGMPVTPPPSEETPQSELIPPEAPAARQTARPLSDNPYQPHRAPYIPSAQPAEKKPEPAPESAPAAAPVQESAAPKPLIPPSPKRVFLFEEELEEQRKAAADILDAYIRNL